MTDKTEKIKCDEELCVEEFPTVSAAIQHKFRKHRQSNVKHYCPYCGMQFPIKYCRDKHVLSHENEGGSSGVHQCTECEATFYNDTALQYHAKSIHNRVVKLIKAIETPPPSRKIKCNNAKEPQSVYYCHLCGSEYIMKYNLEVHLERQHKEEERNALPQELIKCKMCDALFFNKRAYENHNLFHKSDDVYIENEQQRQTLVTRVDQDFDIRRVQTQAEKFLPKAETLSRGRKRKAQTSKQKSSSVRWKSSAAEAVDAGNDSDCLSSASSVSDSEEEEDKTSNNPEKKQVICE
ncbi:zinc finger and SCAN domain-containing protein 12-like [Daphnia pulicaria]|uniref:zinc finger and SCAN domain-containing protein 12-like n=1 Tax=Daphnia pulicaria TaxID=35523 RepID=UPI001EE9EEC7|nr:zinc finger and SCAN domain-containing protein 12-like [Daphnia pulicaria]XP_046631740.1 zinc finger and SCAN domain-containing protein 12-like [Daphnia pulicaria]